MAPSATETVVAETQTAVQNLKLHSTPTNNLGTGSYKLFRSKFDKEAETGQKDVAPAKVRLFPPALVSSH